MMGGVGETNIKVKDSYDRGFRLLVKLEPTKIVEFFYVGVFPTEGWG